MTAPPVPVRPTTPHEAWSRPEGSDLRKFERLGFDTHRVTGAIPQISDFDGLTRLQVTG